MKQLKDFQKTGVKFMTSQKTALLADDMGLGKTVQAATVIKELKCKRALVLTLATLKFNWERELKSWIRNDLKCQVVLHVADKIDKTADVIICNYDLVIYKEIRKQLRDLDYDVVILDEAHVLSNSDAKRTKAVYDTQFGIIRGAKRAYLLTGTPVRNRPKDFFIMLKVFAPHCIEPYTSYEAYAQRYCGAYYDSYGALNDKGASNIDELAEKIKPFMLRRTKDEVLKELPPLIEKTIPLELTPEIEHVLNNEQELYENANEFSENSDLGIQATTRRLLGLAKLPQVTDYLRNLLLTQQKVVVFAYHREVIDKIRKDLKGYGVRVVAGGLTPRLKQMEVDLFVSDPNSHIFVGQYTAAGFGVDGLQKVASHVVFAEIDWVPGNIDQARDRIRRIGQTNPVVAHYLVVPDTLEDNMLQSVIKKKKVIEKLISTNENIVSNMKKEKEKKDMTIEENLERIANSLEKLVEVQNAMIGIASTAELACNSCATEPKEEPKKKTTKKAATKKAEPVESTPVVEAEPVEPVTTDVDDFMAEVENVPEPARVYTQDDVRTAFSQFIARYSNDRNASVAKAKEILAKYNCFKVTEIPQEKFEAVVTELNSLGRAA